MDETIEEKKGSLKKFAQQRFFGKRRSPPKSQETIFRLFLTRRRGDDARSAALVYDIYNDEPFGVYIVYTYVKPQTIKKRPCF